MTSSTRNRFGQFGSAAAMTTADQPRSSHAPSFGQGLGNVSAAWGNGIWGNGAIGSGLKTAPSDIARPQEERMATAGSSETVTGSGSLLSTSESDNWTGRQRPSWPSVDNTSPGLPSGATRRNGTSPMRRQNSNQPPPQPFTDSSSTASPFFSITPVSSSLALAQQNSTENNGSALIPARAYDTNGYRRPSRHNSDEEDRFNARSLVFGSNEPGLSMQNHRQLSLNSASGLNSSVASRSGSMPPSRNGVGPGSQYGEDSQPTMNLNFGGLSSTGNAGSSRLSPQVSTFSRDTTSYNQRVPNLPTAMTNLSNDFAAMGILKENQPQQSAYGLHTGSTFPDQRPIPYPNPQAVGTSSNNVAWDMDENGQPDYPLPYPANNQMPFPAHGHHRNTTITSSYSRSPVSNDGRRNHSNAADLDGSSNYALQSRASSRSSFGGQAPVGQAFILDRKLRGLQQEQQSYGPAYTNPLHFRPPFPNPYDFHSHNALRMNPLNSYYAAPPMANLLPQTIPRGPAKDQDSAHSTRSACLEEFRSNSKTNKRYELKDIHEHIVEFSGDQHGSRFIQQKLETANSDEKDQAFREILPNAMQLMTDVFGNYVIQKFFEHGSQAQKKVLANQMKNHILALSLQMYGCRVVQKALEHILTDQQASLIAELQKDKQVMRCVKDQNGNHVIQKAIERIPAAHIQFILNAFTGQVHELSKHAYGCRVIQRMLEHCIEPTKSAILQELHGCAQYLIGDQYGNYVTQHVIEHGGEANRAAIITLVTSNVINYSKHKFASNVVETCIKFGNAEQRKKIIDIMTGVNDRGDSNLQYLIRDQYCNYVIQTLIHELKGAELDDFVEIVKPQLAILKQVAYGKQVQAIEALVYNTVPPLQIQPRPSNLIPPPIDTTASAATTPALLTGDAQSPQSSSIPSTNASSVGGAAAGSRKSSGSNAVEILTPTST
ncbi:MAG: hypothetical protein Q9222_006442 [Ikaeria aurantiellina]